MVLNGTLRVLLGLLCLCLCLRGTEAQDVDQNALARIIRYIQTKYSPKEDGQYAVAIYVPVGYCSEGSNPDDGEFLKNDEPRKARPAMNGPNKVYEGEELIAATRLQVKPSRQPNDYLHSEYLLLKHPDEAHSPMKNLLNKHKDRCLIFYTYNSPCKRTCLNKDNRERNILETLKNVFYEFKGPKAFVYNRIFYNDTADFQEYLNMIEGNIYLYRCYPVFSPERKRERSRDRSRLATSRDRSRLATSHKRPRRATSPDRSHKPIPYECHHCFNSSVVAPQCVNKNV